MANINNIEFTATSRGYTFTTSGTFLAPSVTTVFALPLLEFAVFLGRLNSMGTGSPVEVHFGWGENQKLHLRHQTPNLDWLTQDRQRDCCALTPTTYHFRAVAIADGTHYGLDMSFTITRWRYW